MPPPCACQGALMQVSYDVFFVFFLCVSVLCNISAASGVIKWMHNTCVNVARSC